jgi:hypothetical protein
MNEDLSSLRQNKKLGQMVVRHKISWTDRERQIAKPEIDQYGDIQILYHPKPDDPPGLYIAGLDPYAFNTAESSDSLGSLFVFKRIKNMSEPYNLPVCQYTCRPDKMEDFHDNVVKILAYYKAKVLYENNIRGFFEYADRKGYLNFLLAPPRGVVKDILPNSKVDRGKGIHMVKEIKDFMENCIKNYIEDNCGATEDSDMGKIMFPDLLEELIRYNNTGNFDRVIAFGLCLIYDLEAQKLHRFGEEGNKPKIGLGFYSKDSFGNLRYLKA